MPDIRRGPHGRIRLDALTSYDTEGFNRLYEIYAALFPLADEREPPEEFFRILGFNEDLAVQEAYGPYREIVAAVRLWDAGPVIGGHVFGITTSADHLEADIPASVQVIYTFLHENYRGTFPIPDFIKYAQAMAISTFGEKGSSKPLIVFEVNNPLRMTEEEIASDTLHSGLHPARRYMFWLRSGFKPLEFPYVQPRLRDGADPVRYLDLFCSGEFSAIPAKVLLNHLKSFCSISVLKCRNASEDADFHRMETWLSERDKVTVLGRENPQIRKIAELGSNDRRRTK